MVSATSPYISDETLARVAKRFRRKAIGDDRVNAHLDRLDQRDAQKGATPPATDTPPKSDESPTAPVPAILANWREILIALGLHPNVEDREKVRRLNKTYRGPIITGGQGKQPLADKAKLLEWWRGLEAKTAAMADRNRDTRATVAAQHNYGQRGVVVPDIRGRVKSRRRGWKP